MAQDRQSVELARDLGAHLVTQLPDALRQLVDKERDFAIA
jgi:hypothetical protein